MKSLRLLAFASLILVFSSASQEAEAGGWMSRVRNSFKAPATQRATPQRYSNQRSRSYRNVNTQRSRLPGGRSYYQGRYFGNFNNRFYGPQYGYF